MVVDRDARDRLAALLRRLVAGRITNDEFEASLPLSSPDAGVNRIFRDGAWRLYDDRREYRLVGSRRVPRVVRRQVARWILFLKSDLAYEWPRPPWWLGFASLVLNVLSLGLVGLVARESLRRTGALEVWPFYRQSDYEAARGRPPYFAKAV